MRIGIDGRLWGQTGVGRYIRSLWHYLPVFDKESEYVWFLGKAEYETLALPSPKWKKVRADVPWHTLREQLILPWIFLKEDLDLLHFPYFTFPILYPRKFVVTIHDLIIDHYKTGQWSTLPSSFFLVKKLAYHLVNWVSIYRSEKILTLSNDARNELVAHYWADPKKIVVTYESGSLEDKRKTFSGERVKYIKSLQPYLLYVGNAHQHKNIESLVEAVHMIRKSNPKIKLVLVGMDNFFYPRLRIWIHKMGYDADVAIIGEVPNSEIAAWYHFAKALASAAKMEGFGIPPLEAMSQGCPAIVSNIAVFHEVYGDAAVYFNQDDPADIADTITRTLANKKLLASQIKLGYKQSAKYSWEKLVAETVAVYHQVL